MRSPRKSRRNTAISLIEIVITGRIALLMFLTRLRSVHEPLFVRRVHWLSGSHFTVRAKSRMSTRPDRNGGTEIMPNAVTESARSSRLPAR
jgi:hypothetical protein